MTLSAVDLFAVNEFGREMRQISSDARELLEEHRTMDARQSTVQIHKFRAQQSQRRVQAAYHLSEQLPDGPVPGVPARVALESLLRACKGHPGDEVMGRIDEIAVQMVKLADQIDDTVPSDDDDAHFIKALTRNEELLTEAEAPILGPAGDFLQQLDDAITAQQMDIWAAAARRTPGADLRITEEIISPDGSTTVIRDEKVYGPGHC